MQNNINRNKYLWIYFPRLNHFYTPKIYIIFLNIIFLCVLSNLHIDFLNSTKAKKFTRVLLNHMGLILIWWDLREFQLVIKTLKNVSENISLATTTQRKSVSSSIDYLGLNSDTVTSLTEIEVFDEDPLSLTTLPTENAGRVGLGRVTVSLASMWTTLDIVGLSAASSCTHNRPMCTHFRISLGKHDFSINGSINSKPLLSHQKFHAYNCTYMHLVLVISNFIYFKYKHELGNLHIWEGFFHALKDRICCSFFHLWSLAKEHQSWKHLTSPKTSLP